MLLSILYSPAFTLSGSFLLLCGYLGTTTATAVTFLTIAVGSSGLVLSGFGCNHLDIAPRYAGVLLGLTNAVATVPGIIGPYIAKAIAHKVCNLQNCSCVANLVDGKIRFELRKLTSLGMGYGVWGGVEKPIYSSPPAVLSIPF